LLEKAQKKRVISGMRPTGRLHIGHYFGALENWVRLQNDPAYECFYFIADWHALTSDYADTSGVAQNTLEIMIDYLAADLDPKKSVIFQQSLIPEHAELHLLLSMVTPLGWLERVPTYKEALENVKDKDLHTYGFLGYPVLQCGDIVMYSKEGVPLFVPVGEDQVAHVELSREIVATFNFHFGFEVEYEKWRDEDLQGLTAALYPRGGAPIPQPTGRDPQAFRHAPVINRDVLWRQLREEGPINFARRIGPTNMKYFRLTPALTEPEAMLTKTPRIPGLDGRKMSKSYGNAIMLSESDADIRAKTKVMVTDPARKRRSDPGNPDVCPVYDWHKLFSPPETLEWSAKGCRTAGIGCIECKAAMADNLIKWITPVRERRQQYEKHPERVLQVIDEGSQKARIIAQRTMERVREAVFGWESKRKEIHGGTAAKA
jgi:tryptophanyl-tRNA synthetase